MTPNVHLQEDFDQTAVRAHSEKLARLLKKLEADDPDFLKDYIDGLEGRAKTDLKAALDTAQGRGQLNEEQIASVIKELASAYIIKRAPVRSETLTVIPDAALRPFHQLACEYGINALALESLNTKSPLPQSITEIHEEGEGFLPIHLRQSPGYAMDLCDTRRNFTQLSDEKKLAFGRLYLELLATAYDVYPAPTLEVDPLLDGLGLHTRFSPQNCFAYPLGRIFIQTLDLSYKDFIETLSHEFAHSLEDLAMFSINPYFQEWRKQNPYAVGIGDEKMQENLRAAALAFSFNTASAEFARFKGLCEDIYEEGAYYRFRPIKDNESDDEQRKINELYYEQLRERHANLYECIITKSFNAALDKIEKISDPLNVFMMAQNGMFKAYDFIKDTLLPAIPNSERPAYEAVIQGMEVNFKKADARDATYHDRMRLMGAAFTSLRTMIIDADRDGYLSVGDDKVRAMRDLCSDISSDTDKALQLMAYKVRKALSLKARTPD